MCPSVVVYVTVSISVTNVQSYWSEFTIQFTTAILCENAHNHADYSSAQWAVTTLVRYATCTVLAESCVSAGHQGKAFDWCQQTNFTTP